MTTHEDFQQTEDDIPALAKRAVREAYAQALNSGQSVFKVEDGYLVEVSADGSRRLIRKLESSVSVEAGQSASLR